LIWDPIARGFAGGLSLTRGWKIVLVKSILHSLTQHARHLSREGKKHYECRTCHARKNEYRHYAECLPRGMLGCHRHYYQYQPAVVALFLCALMSISSALFGSGRVRSSS
jgi:hypothetical protein